MSIIIPPDAAFPNSSLPMSISNPIPGTVSGIIPFARIPVLDKTCLGYFHADPNYGFWNISYVLWGLADLAIVQQRIIVAAQLLGAANHLRQLTPDHFPKFFHSA